MTPQRNSHHIRSRPASVGEWDCFQALLGVAYTIQQEFEDLRRDTNAALEAVKHQVSNVQWGFPPSLQRIVTSAQTMTEASGAAIALGDEHEMLCVARNGKVAPPLGSGFSSRSGLSGECVRTREDVICVNSAADPRVDYGAANALGARSMLYLPLISSSDKLIGVLAVFSSEPQHFSHRDFGALRWAQYLVLEALKSNDHSELGAGTIASQLIPPEQHAEHPKPPEAPTLNEEEDHAPVAAEELAALEAHVLGAELPDDKGPDLELPSPIAAQTNRVPLIAAVIVICLFIAGIAALSVGKYHHSLKQTPAAPVARPSIATPISQPAPAPPPDLLEAVAGLPSSVRMKSEAPRVRMAIDLANPITYEAFAIHAPDRVYFDLYGVTLSAAGASSAITSDVVSRVRISEFQSGVTRLVFDLKPGVPFRLKTDEANSSLSIELTKASLDDKDAIVLRPGSALKLASTMPGHGKPTPGTL